MSIREALPCDIPTIHNLVANAYESESLLYVDPLPPLSYTLEDTQREAHNGYVFLKLEIDGIIFGSVRCYLEGETTSIHKLVVHPEWRGKGFGKKLLESAEQFFSEARRCILFTGDKSLRNLHIYHEAGYRQYDIQRGGPNHDLIFLEKFTKRERK